MTQDLGALARDAQRRSRQRTLRGKALAVFSALALGTAVGSAWAAAPVLTLDPYADGTAQAGATKAATCTACHGVNGNSINAQWPRLAGQNAVYIDEQLHLFKAGVRNNAVMMPMSTTLSDKDIDDLAVYYEAQTPIGGEADPSYWQAGATLYKDGDTARNIPACIACHGPVGRGNLASGYPALRAQYAEYVMKQLQDFASGARYGGAAANKPQSRNGAMMATIAKLLTPVDMRNVASYVQGMR
ncbi:MAG TPA: c-type cytochrome [Steroidobacteraceae bacterium]|nr:c-type cytochrome [Steroidobacteraceae bacterium]